MLAVDVTSFLLKIDSNKYTGIEGISSRRLKVAARIIAPSIVKLINLSFSLNQFPEHWSWKPAIDVIDDLLFNLDNYYVSEMTMVVYCKAFDMVGHTLLFKKPQIYGLTKESLL